MSFVSNILDRRKVWKSLRNYPVYSPPFRDAEAVLSKREIAENYKYFLEQKGRRLDYLATYFSSFSIELRLDREVLPTLDHWLRRFGGQLIPRTEPLSAFVDHEPEWNQDYLGLNVVNDIGIFAGDYIISKNQSVRWDAYYGDGTKYDYEEPGFSLPCLFGLSRLTLNIEDVTTPFCMKYSSAAWRVGGGWSMAGSAVRGTSPANSFDISTT